jgi:hypothetical protein
MNKHFQYYLKLMNENHQMKFELYWKLIELMMVFLFEYYAQAQAVHSIIKKINNKLQDSHQMNKHFQYYLKLMNENHQMKFELYWKLMELKLVHLYH